MQDSILSTITKFIIPFILLFALYIQFHGEISPGGGFQAGVIFASAFLLYALTFGIHKAQTLLSNTTLKFYMSLGLLIYAGTGIVTMLRGGNFLSYNYLYFRDPIIGQKMGILTIELGIGLTVFSAVTLLFYLLLDHEK
jgi:multicomponent Na+:H+ antiporter subunit B